ncbi:MAG: hypothetical protein ACUVRY_08970 [Thermoanaerobaculaceae bacterium]
MKHLLSRLKPSRRWALTGRGLTGEVCWWSFALEIPYAQLRDLALPVAGLVGGYWEEKGKTLGWVGLAPESEPILLSFAPRRDLLAQRLLASTVENPSHTYPQLWITLAPGVYLAQVVDPNKAPSVARVDLLGLVDGSRVTELLYLVPSFQRRHFALSGLWIQPTGERGPLLHRLRKIVRKT